MLAAANNTEPTLIVKIITEDPNINPIFAPISRVFLVA